MTSSVRIIKHGKPKTKCPQCFSEDVVAIRCRVAGKVLELDRDVLTGSCRSCGCEWVEESTGGTHAVKESS